MSEQQEVVPVDRTGWGAGEWDGEPDRAEWRTREGFPALALRQRNGHWCGYVAVPPGHPWHGKGYDDMDVEVHGGLTYADACAGHICHVPVPGEPDNVWWLGFDCAHAWDVSPGRNARYPEMIERDQHYRTLGYVRGQCEALAEQVKAALLPAPGKAEEKQL